MKRYGQPLVLMYHGIVSGKDSIPLNREVGAELYDVDQAQFTKQMQWLKENNYDASSTDIALSSNKDKTIITFDDGEFNNSEYALPVLESFGFKAYFFVIAKRIGKPGYMGWKDLKKLKNAGMTIGSHGLSHEILTNLLDTQIEEELRGSKNYIERNLGITVDSLSIPRGFCNNKIINMAYELGYKSVFISERSEELTAPCFERVAIKGSMKTTRFVKTIKGEFTSYDKMIDGAKKLSKKILGENGYNRIRSLIIKIVK